MKPIIKSLSLATAVVTLSVSGFAGSSKSDKATGPRVETARSESAVLWREPLDIKSRNLFYGPGGEKDQPHGPFTFVEEDLKGTNAKYIVRDADKVKWTVKLGLEVKPETVSSRIVWGAGFFTNEDYYLQDLQVEGMPAHLKRGSNLVGPGGVMHSVRLKRHSEELKSQDNWSWREGAWAATRELNGLKVMMALINNWDLKDDNNDVYVEKNGKAQFYMVSDLGASFGATGLSFPFSHSKGDLHVYEHSKFISKSTPDYVDFGTPSRPALIYMFRLPEFIRRVELEQITRRVPRADVQWMAHVLAGLSPDQIRDAFRAAGYSQADIDGFTKVVQARIAELNRL